MLFLFQRLEWYSQHCWVVFKNSNSIKLINQKIFIALIAKLFNILLTFQILRCPVVISKIHVFKNKKKQ